MCFTGVFSCFFCMCLVASTSRDNRLEVERLVSDIDGHCIVWGTFSHFHTFTVCGVASRSAVLVFVVPKSSPAQRLLKITQWRI